MERALALLSIILLTAAVIAVAKGMDQWHILPWQIWAHLATLATALVITPIMLLRKRGDKSHRIFGWIWALSMLATALISFDIRLTNDGNFSLIHILSVITVIGVPVLIISARRRDIKRHRSQARGFIIGALLVAGFFTFPFDRLLGHWLFG
ncbi:hypothetical protein LPB140_06375 [Sphingorhabdus lutea]|uniref:DUF2306 domain-containing protein n=2 Tax=Sphingorhabdus lutea TaxID=1913578 RepID=A0A1L3JET6_9SPHN|nr:hypothetical protein LPB140_06375 [Sphingorhabdus lutea]